MEIIMTFILVMFQIITVGTLAIGIGAIIWTFTRAEFREAYKIVFIDSWKEILHIKK